MYNFFKRISDFIAALIATILLTPILTPIIIGLLLTGEGYVWYFQTRMGKKNKTFQIWKFATMLKDSVNMKGGLITTQNDPRITPMGGFLRKSKINDLLSFYMGKNTQERQEFIIDKLRVEKDLIDIEE